MLTDQELWSAVKKHDERAFASLFHRYFARIYSNAYSHIRDQQVCEQLVHDIFMTLWENRATLQVHSFQAYLTAAARYRVYKHITASKVIPLDYKEKLEDCPGFATPNAGYHQLAFQDMELEVDSCLGNLPKSCRQIFVMSRKEFLSNDEIAKRLGISKRTVENQITHALKHLRLLLRWNFIALLASIFIG